MNHYLKYLIVPFYPFLMAFNYFKSEMRVDLYPNLLMNSFSNSLRLLIDPVGRLKCHVDDFVSKV
jgi:hypothetical protein